MEEKVPKIKTLASIIGIFPLLLVFLAHPLLMSQEHRPLKYRVDVKASVVPLFVVDSKGNAVFDLKKEDLELYVNGKLTDIYEMMAYRFESRGEVEGVQPGQRVSAEPNRVIFIVLDSMNCSLYGVDRSKRIAVELIRKGNRGDMFVILMVTLESGLKYTAGPERKSEDLVKRVKKLKIIPGESVSRQFLTDHAARIAIKHFVNSIAQLKYALKTITKPKVLFLISEGLSKKSWGGIYSSLSLTRERERRERFGERERERASTSYNLHYYFTYLMKAVNQGGCVINMLYSGRSLHMRDATLAFLGPVRSMPGIEADHLVSSDWVLKTIAVKSGGAFFIDPDIDTMVTSVKQTTAAYYEAVYIHKQEMKQRQKIHIKSKRKDIVIHTLNYTEAEKEYKKMENTQKKVFAINVATEGSWSRMVGQVRRTAYKKLQKEKKGKDTSYKIEVPIPGELRNKQADIFLLRFDKGYKYTDINYINQNLREKEVLEITSKKKKKLLYFVIIEPESTYTIYNQVK